MFREEGGVVVHGKTKKCSTAYVIVQIEFTSRTWFEKVTDFYSTLYLDTALCTIGYRYVYIMLLSLPEAVAGAAGEVWGTVFEARLHRRVSLKGRGPS